MMADVNMVHVPYRSAGAALTDLISEQVHVYFGTTASSIEHIKAGKIRALGVTTTARAEALPDVTSPPRSATRAFILGSARPALISLLSI